MSAPRPGGGGRPGDRPTAVDVRRATDRFRTAGGGLSTWHSFSFGTHYDPANVGFGVLVAHNDDSVAPGHGYDTHPHADLEIVTWVLEGSLVHEDSAGHAGVLEPGVVQVLGAGSGVLHSERNDAPGAASPTRFVQVWLRPDEPGLPPTFARAAVDGAGLVPLASGTRGLDAGVRVRTTGAALHVARLAPGQSVELPDASRLHVFAAAGSVDLEGVGRLDDGDAARLRNDTGAGAGGGRRLSAPGGGPAGATAGVPGEVLIWQLP